MTGKLYVMGVGPGDPELLTLKAVRILKNVPCLCVPKGREEGSSLALSIAEKAVDLAGKEIIEAHFPMKKTADRDRDAALDAKWSAAAAAIEARLREGKDVAFITLGDPAIYSTFFYLFDQLMETQPRIAIEIVPGVSSITAAAARAGLSLSLADEKIAIVPATYALKDLTCMLSCFDTVVFMKVHKVFNSIVGLLEGLGLAGKAVYVVKAGMENERIFTNIKDVRDEDLHYFSLLIARK
jgi:precorrin-2/cobalt-factor-2 C20-methyltransferase